MDGAMNPVTTVAVLPPPVGSCKSTDRDFAMYAA
jgi:hypothetical protein